MQRIVCGCNKWHRSRFAFCPHADQPAAASSGWNGDTFKAKLCFVETPYIVTLTLAFGKNEVVVSAEQNVGFGPTKFGPVTGKGE